MWRGVTGTVTSDGAGGRVGWPRFELATPDLPPDIPAFARERLSERGVPKGLIAHEYRIADRATQPTEDLVCFGSSGLDGKICIEVPSGSIVRVFGDASTRRLVNSDLEAFTAVVSAVIERFPFYTQDSELEDWTRAADDIRGIVAGIDPPALADTGFWETFTDDVENGDYPTEDVIDDDD
jgi:hypothetical protein